mgnify:CR=1 FL=1
MHELSLLQALVEQVTELAQKERFCRVVQIRLGVGPLSGVEPECLQLCFAEAARDTALHDAKLVLEQTPLELQCKACGQRSCPDAAAELCCVGCGSLATQIIRGRELCILDLDVQ